MRPRIAFGRASWPSSRLVAGLALWAVTLRLGAAPLPLEPYVIDHKSRVDSAADVAFLLDGPAGKDGFIGLKDGHLAKPNGERFRIWGVNLTGWGRGSTNLPPKDDAAVWAKALARLGVNCVRFHFLDMATHVPEKEAEREAFRRKGEAAGRRNTVPPDGLIDDRRDDSQSFDAEALDRLDYFFAELKRVGIYSNLNLNVGRSYRVGDGVPDHDLIHVAKGVTYIGERLIELQRDYARKLLTHRNPYTQLEYRNDPAVVTVEIVNENSLLEFWMRNWLRGELTRTGPRYQLDLTPQYAAQLDAMFNAWLDENRSPAERETLRQETRVGREAPVPRLRRGEFALASAARFQTEAEFYCHVEREFLTGMYQFLKKELGVKPLVIGTADHTYWIPSQPMLRANSQLDFLDGHVYWQHPAIWGARNTPMVNDPLNSTIVKLSRSPMAGRAFTVSEVNHPNPTEYAAEMIPILAAYAAFQDWDGVYFYTFEPKVGDGWDHFATDEFDLALDPVKCPQLPVGALLFLRGDVRPAREIVTRSYSATQVLETMRLPESERPMFTPGFPRSLALRHGSRIRDLAGEPTAPLGADPAPPYVSDTGELVWQLSPERQGTVTIDTPRSQALVGFVRDQRPTTRHLAAEVKNDFCAITLSSLGDQPISRAPRMLLTTSSRWQNTGTRWNERRTLWSEWGTGPTLIEPVAGWLMLRELDGAVAVKLTPLDGAARPIGEPIAGRRMEIGWEVPLGAPATTQYLLEVIR